MLSFKPDDVDHNVHFFFFLHTSFFEGVDYAVTLWTPNERTHLGSNWKWPLVNSQQGTTGNPQSNNLQVTEPLQQTCGIRNVSSPGNPSDDTTDLAGIMTVASWKILNRGLC